MDQSETIVELRSKFLAKLTSEGVHDPPKEFHPNDLERIKDDIYLKRFLDHNEGDVNMALQMMWDTYLWRKTFGTNEINETNINMEFINEGAFFPRGRDIDGRLMLIFRCSKHFKGRKDLEEIKKCIVYWFERVERQEKGNPITLFFDMEGCGLSNMDMEFTKYLIGLFKFYYPYFLNYIIIYEMPWLLSAPFKIIKQLLPAKAVSKMKFLSSSNLKDFVPPEQALSCWGGKDDYEFKFEPETKNGTQTEVTKKVTFATEDKNTKNGELLTLTPHDFIVFAKDGIDVSGTFTILNDGDKIVSFKIRTTSPEKFRVRPSTGVLKPGQSQTIVIVVQAGYKLNIVSKDRFLVMCVPITDVNLSTQQLAEVWQGSSSTTIEEYRLKCSFPEGENNNKYTNLKDISSSNDKDYENLKKKVDSLQTCNNKLHKDIKFIKILQLFIMVVSSLALFFAYMIYDIQKDGVHYSKDS